MNTKPAGNNEDSAKNRENLISRIPLHKQCRVCGDMALCFNFDGLSCEACKKFECKKQGNTSTVITERCVIDKTTRKKCKKCRLDKCFEIGMKKELITNFNSNSSCESHFSAIPIANQRQLQAQIMEEKLPKTISDSTELQSYDLLRIHEVCQAMTVFRNETTMDLIGTSSDLVHVINLLEFHVRKTVKFCKSIHAFKCLTASDQLQLLKAFYPESSAVYGAYIYNVEQDGLPVVVNEADEKTIFVKLNISPDIKRKQNAVTFRNFVLPMNAAMVNDETIRDLIIAQLLFKPRNNTSCPEFIKYNFSVYGHLLWKYLRCRYRTAADRMLSSVECALTDVETASGIFRDVFIHELVLDQVKQILIEMFDLR